MRKIEIRIIDNGQSRSGSRAKGIFVTLLFFAALFGPGVIADSPAMQWAGFVLLIVLMSILLTVWSSTAYTIEEARAKLDKLEAASKSK